MLMINRILKDQPC